MLSKVKNMEDLSIQQLQKGLTRRLEYCLDAEDYSTNLVVSIYDYIEYINKHPVLDYLLTTKIQERPKKILEKLNKLEKETEKELDAVFEDISKKTSKKEKESIKSWIGNESAFDEYKGQKSGKILSSRGKIVSMHDTLEEILTKLCKKRKKNDFEEYIELKPIKGSNHSTVHTNISERYKEFFQIRNYHKNEKPISAWGGFEEIYICYQAIEGFIGNFSDNVEEQQNLKFLASAYESLKNKTRDAKSNPLVSRNKKTHLKRLHLGLLDQLDFVENKENYIPKTMQKSKRLNLEKLDNQKKQNNFKFNKDTGDFVFNETKGNLTINSQEYKVLKNLLFAENNQVDYFTLIKNIWTNREDSKTNRNDLSLVIKRIKTILKILPKKNAKNPDIFKNIKGFGYRIIVE